MIKWTLSQDSKYFSGRNMNVFIISGGRFLDLPLFQLQFSSITTLSFEHWKVLSQGISPEPILALMTLFLAHIHDHSAMSCTIFETSLIWVYPVATTFCLYRQLSSFPVLLMLVKERPTASSQKSDCNLPFQPAHLDLVKWHCHPILNEFLTNTSSVILL